MIQLSEHIVLFNSPDITILDFDNCRTWILAWTNNFSAGLNYLQK